MPAAARVQRAHHKGETMKSPRSARAARVMALAVAAGASTLLYAQTVNLRPGSYEFTSVIDLQLPPEVAAKIGALLQQPHVTQQCITETDLEHVSKNINEGHNDQNCKITERSVTGNDVKFTMQCPNGTRHFEGTFMSDSFKALMTMTGERGPVTIRMTARRLGDCSK
jgi:hypothetical protein